MIFDYFKSVDCRLLILINRVIFLLTILVVSIQPYITNNVGNSLLKREFFFFTEIQDDGSISFVISMLSIFFMLLLLIFLIFKYNKHNFEVLPLTFIPLLLFYVIHGNFILEFGYFLFVGAILVDIGTLFVLSRKNLLDIEFLDFFSNKYDHLRKESVRKLDYLDSEIIQEEEKIKNRQLIAILIFMLTPIVTSLGANLPYAIQNILQNKPTRISEINSIITIGLPISWNNYITLSLDYLLFALIIELILFLIIVCLFLNKGTGLINKISEKNFLFFLSLAILALTIYASLLLFNNEPSLLYFLIWPVYIFLIYPFLLIPIFMIDKKVREPRIGFEGLLIVLAYSIIIVVLSLLTLNSNFWGIQIREFESMVNTELRPTMIVFFLPIIARYLWNEGKSLE